MSKKKMISGIPQFVITGLFLLTLVSCQYSPGKKYTVMQGNFVQSVTETGDLEATNASRIVMPRLSYRYGYSYKLIGLAEHGKIVEKGDSVVALDPANIYKYIIQQQESLENTKAKAEKQRVQAENTLRDLEVQLKNEEAAHDLKKLELERMQFESDIKKKVKELEYRKVQLRLKKIKRKLELNPIVEKYDRRINELEILQRQSDIQNALEVLQNLVIYSPGKGYFQISNSRRSGNNYQLGDEVYMGSVIARIPDVSQMKAMSYINETDISKIKQGSRVIIRLDALPEITFEGTLQNISKICTEKDKQKIFQTEVEILDHDQRLKPGMSVSCEYIIYESDNALYVPNKCLLSEGKRTFLFVKKGRNFKKTEVKTGISNASHTIIHTRIKPGRELLSLNEEL